MLAMTIGGNLKQYREEVLNEMPSFFAHNNDLSVEELERLEAGDNTLPLASWEKALTILSLLNGVESVVESKRTALTHMSRRNADNMPL